MLRNIDVRVVITVATLCLTPIQGLNAKGLTADNAKIVDCLLPGKLKQLGLQRTYVSKKRPVKTSANECAIRGGEFVLEDRASLVSALKVWQESATLGDKEAQYYIGEIYEKGMGQAPDYDLAHLWYKKSATQGYAPAMMSLGRMYEAGLGVEKDLVQAMNYYRQASGLEGEEIAYISAFDDLRQQDKQEILSLQGQLDQQKEISRQLSEELQQLRDNLKTSNGAIDQLKSDIESRQQKLKAITPPSNDTLVLKAQTLESELSSANARLQKQNILLDTLTSELALARSGAQSSEVIQGELKSTRESLLEKESRVQQQQIDLDRLKNQLKKAQSELASSAPKKQLILVTNALENDKDYLQKSLETSQAEAREYREMIKRLKKDKSKLKSSDEKVLEQKFKITQLESRLVASDGQVKQLNEQLDGLNEELERVKKQSKGAKTDNASRVSHLQDSLNKRSLLHERELANLKTQLAEEKERVVILETRLKAASSEQNNEDAYIKSLEDKISEANSGKESIAKDVHEKSARLKDAEEKIKQLEAQIATLPNRQEFEKLQAELVDKQAQLEKETARASQLLDEIAVLNKEKQQIDTDTRNKKAVEGPVIAVQWPKVIGTRGKVASGTQANIVGAVYSSASIEEFTINGKKQKLDAHGLFLAQMDVSDSELNVEMVARDMTGKTATRKITLKPTIQAVATGEKPKVKMPKVNFGKFHALVIGNNAYDNKKGWSPLNTAVNDARTVAELLEKRYGFEVTLKIDSTREDMLIALEQMRKKLSDGDNLLVYYAGHGYMDPENDQGYWIPVDGSASSTINWVSNATITDQIRAMTARNVMVIADSCYSGSLMRSGVVTLRSGLSTKKKLLRLQDDVTTVTRMALSSGGLQPVADAIGDSQHSVFANALLKVLRDNNGILDGSSLATEVGLTVSVDTQDNVKQVPRYAPLSKGGHQGGEFYFIPKRS